MVFDYLTYWGCDILGAYEMASLSYGFHGVLQQISRLKGKLIWQFSQIVWACLVPRRVRFVPSNVTTPERVYLAVSLLVKLLRIEITRFCIVILFQYKHRFMRERERALGFMLIPFFFIRQLAEE